MARCLRRMVTFLVVLPLCLAALTEGGLPGRGRVRDALDMEDTTPQRVSAASIHASGAIEALSSAKVEASGAITSLSSASKEEEDSGQTHDVLGRGVQLSRVETMNDAQMDEAAIPAKSSSKSAVEASKQATNSAGDVARNDTKTTPQLAKHDTKIIAELGKNSTKDAAEAAKNSTKSTTELVKNSTKFLAETSKNSTKDAAEATKNSTKSTTGLVKNSTKFLAESTKDAESTKNNKSSSEGANNNTKVTVELARNGTKPTAGNTTSTAGTAVIAKHDSRQMLTSSPNNQSTASRNSTSANKSSQSEALTQSSQSVMRKQEPSTSSAPVIQRVVKSNRGDVIAGAPLTPKPTEPPKTNETNASEKSLKSQLTEELQSRKLQSNSWLPDVLILSAGVFLYPAHRAGQAGLTWLSLLFATQALMSGIFHYCEEHHLENYFDGPACTESTFHVFQLAIRGMYYFVFLQVAFLLCGPEDPILQRLEPTFGTAAAHNTDILGVPLSAFVLTRALPTAVFAMMFSFIIVGDHAVGSIIFHSELLGACCATFISVMCFFWIGRPTAAAKVFSEGRFWLRVASCVIFAFAGLICHMALVPKDAALSDDRMVGESIWNALVAVMAGLAVQMTCWDSLAYNDMGEETGRKMPAFN
eukprot:CAMPEP_0197703148 /NCGR_PEP_ID=MMETSP1338-20131121/125292_1 /TAXON_ID=43686 ORGANISM="Pelagodinium beii, Strain RCC1491" /NCGR_SAMPLE_ID=MMETSP1338 /ASSEMBLY_ACC=CAM_ASM_000754 /LENGTH=644 /DNA_ID=CAMNT_0043287041 /DNA_START=11 /DNA_END=1945 /DNA_ORIENTATION=+